MGIEGDGAKAAGDGGMEDSMGAATLDVVDSAGAGAFIGGREGAAVDADGAASEAKGFGVDFAAVELSSIYFDVLKDRLYCSFSRWPARRSAQTALHRIAYALVRLVAPLLAFTAEEVWRHMKQPGSVHTALFPEPAELTAGLSQEHRKRLENWDRLMEVREDVLKSLETARQEKFIGAPLEARVNLSANGSLYPLLEEYAQELPALFIVSQVRLNNHGEGLSVAIERADGVGGTWRQNIYPGAACDIQSHLYSFSFAPNRAWTRTYAYQPIAYTTSAPGVNHWGYHCPFSLTRLA